MHHTGIKTAVLAQLVPETAYFNCTIQELKQFSTLEGVLENFNFNCTIQELKLTLQFPFQNFCVFQLHHTGIKTIGVLFCTSKVATNFNCTIQELKRVSDTARVDLGENFNCTIQELKLR